ncbi:serine/threonine protein phosphatase [Bacteroidia bacterium]|nr:serine/threonine protein phosphatase [Bacteroidia bacterium]
MKTCFLKKSIVAVFLLLTVGTLSAQQTKFSEPKLSDPASWTMVLLPDPQMYISFDYNQPLFELMTAWIARNIEPLHIGMVLCTGDLVNQNEYLNPAGIYGNLPSKSQWEFISKAFNRLDGKVPYILAAGNHDYGYESAENRKTNFDRYFPVDKNPLNQKSLKDVGLNADEMPTLTNASFEFVSPQGKKYLVVVLEFAPRDETLAWAKKTIEEKKYENHTVILLTHSYMDPLGEHIEKEGYLLAGPNWGADVWKKLVQPSKNIQMVFAGHIAMADDEKGHVSFRTDTNAGGKKVQQMVFNAQALGGGWSGNGGDGWLRILEFLPDGKTVKVKTFSPLFAASPTTQQFAWRTKPYDEFTFTLE